MFSQTDSKEILALAAKFGLSRGALHAEIAVAESANPLVDEAPVNAMRMVTILLEEAEGRQQAHL